MRVLYTVQSRDDLSDLGDWIAKDSPRRAQSFVQELRAKCRGLGAYPARYPVVGEQQGLKVRRRVHGDYVILFSVTERPEAVVILRVVHGARDYNRLRGRLGLDEDWGSG